MKVIKIDKKQWSQGIEKLRSGYRLLGPVKEKQFHQFKVLEAGQEPDFDFLNTRLSPKDLAEPQSEVMFEYSLDENAEDGHVLKEVRRDIPATAILGIRPCDAKAYLLVKRNFDAPQYKDVYWLRAYDALTRVGLACDRPCSSCFCTTAGCGPYHEEGLDILLVDESDHFLAKVLTEKGEALVKAAGWEAETASETDAQQIESRKKTAEERISSAVKTDKLRPKATISLYDAPFWEDVGFSCINCGTCTYLCPTCWCFDIQDENRGGKGVRMRNWDSCMYPLFTLHGSGHNPRGQKIQRVRQRFMHKLKYYVDKYDNGIQCVGCGRCVNFCPVNIDIRRVCELMNEYEPQADSQQ